MRRLIERRTEPAVSLEAPARLLHEGLIEADPVVPGDSSQVT
jgi:hypothetical protein